MSRGLAWSKHHRVRIVAKRFHIQYDCWREGHEKAGPHVRGRWSDPDYVNDREDLVSRCRRLAKWNLACSCGMCTMGKRPSKRMNRHNAKLALRKGNWEDCYETRVYV